jgi:hypothetical protein
MVVQTHYELNPLCAVGRFGLFETPNAAACDRQVMADSASSLTSLTADLGQPGSWIESQFPGTASYLR